MFGLSLVKGKGNAIGVSNMKWGITAKDRKLIINARAESAMDKPLFSDSIKSRRFSSLLTS